MNRERAEAHLRLVAEAELRRATTPPRDGAAMPAALPGAERRPVVLRRSDVAAALYDLPSRQREALALHGPTGGAGVTVREAGTSPGEHLLHQMATRLLLLALAFPHEIRLHPAVPGPDRFSCVADGLGDVIAALQACGAMSVLSPVPGQLAALCASLDVTGHGITARPARQLPGPWLSMLAHYHRRQPEQALGRDGCAAAAAALPELDGIRSTGRRCPVGLWRIMGSRRSDFIAH